MPALLYSGAIAAVSNIVQLLAGCLIASVIYRFFADRPVKESNSLLSRLALISLFSLFGLLLPFGIYGVIPLITAVLAVGYKGYAAGALMISNILFNMTVPYNDPGFVWSSGYRQVLLGFAAGVLAGWLLAALQFQAESVFRRNHLPEVYRNGSFVRCFFRMADDSVKKLGLFLAIGAVAEAVFRGYLLGFVMNAFYYNSFTASIPVFFGGKNVSNPFFLLVFVIAYMLMNLVNLSALVAVVKPKGIVRYFGYFILWALVLAIPAFL